MVCRLELTHGNFGVEKNLLVLWKKVHFLTRWLFLLKEEPLDVSVQYEQFYKLI